MNRVELLSEVIPIANEVLKDAEVSEETDSRSKLRTGDFIWGGEEFSVLEQNTKKLDKHGEPSKFAKLALAGNEVYWLVRTRVDDWFLVVNGVPTLKDKVTSEGTLMEGSAL